MKMWSLRVIILLLFCYACLSSRNGGVRFVSENFFSTLQWEPAQPAFPGERLAYSVQYKIYDDNTTYKMKAECQDISDISALTCNLTEETSSDYNAHYLAQVLVNGRNHGHARFKPMAHTHLGPPSLSRYTKASSLHVNVTLPLGPKGVSVGDIIRRSGKTPYKTEIIYSLHITQPEWAVDVYPNTTGHFVISFRMKATEYCGFVVYRPSSVPGRVRSDNTSFCVSVQGDPLKLLPWLLISAVSLGAVVVTAFMCMCSYVKGGKGVVEPQTLIVTSGAVPRVLPPQDESLDISRMDVVPAAERTLYATIQVKQHVPSVGEGGYSPQDIPGQAWGDGTGSSVEAERPASNSRNTSGQSSVVYSSVAVHVPNQEEDVPQTAVKDTNNPPLFSRRDGWTNGAMGPKLSSHEAPQLTLPVTFDSNPADSTPLLLHAVRNSSGKLELPALTFQLLGNTEDWQRKPLLSDLINCKTEGPSLASVLSPDGSEGSDSGCDDSTLNSPAQPYCNGHYCPSGPVVPDFQQGRLITSSGDDVLKSGYKQNWMPASFLQSEHSCEHAAGTNYPRTWSGLKKDEEDEEDEALAGEELCSPSEILLGDWMVQIHE